MQSFTLLLLAGCFIGSEAFLGVPVIYGQGRSSLRHMSALPLKMAVDADKVEKFVSKGEKAVDSGKAKRVAGKLQKALNKPSGAVAVGIECSPALPVKDDDVLAEFQIPGENGISQKLRSGNAAALWVGKADDGSDIDAIQAFAAEQNSAKGDFPGPVCVIRGGVTSVEEAAEAAAAGAGAVGIDIATVGDDAADLALAAKAMELESVAVVSSAAEAEAGVEAECGLVLAQTDDQEEFDKIRGAVPKKTAALARVSAEGAGVDDAIAKGRDLHARGFTAVMLAGLCSEPSNSLELPCAAIKEIASKRSSVVQVKTVGVRDAEAGGGVGLAAATGAAPAESAAPAAPAKARKVRPNFKKKKATGKTKTPVGGDTWGLDEWNMEDEEDADAAFYEKMK